MISSLDWGEWFLGGIPFAPSRHHLSYDDCLEATREFIRTVLEVSVRHLCTVICTRIWTVLTGECCFMFGLVFVHLFTLRILSVFLVYLGPFFSCVVCCVGFSFFTTTPTDWLRRASLKWPVFVLNGTLDPISVNVRCRAIKAECLRIRCAFNQNANDRSAVIVWVVVGLCRGRCDEEVRQAARWRRGLWGGEVRRVVDHSGAWRRRSNDRCHAA